MYMVESVKNDVHFQVYHFSKPVRGFSIKILLFGWMELGLPTPVSHPPSWRMHLHRFSIKSYCLVGWS